MEKFSIHSSSPHRPWVMTPVTWKDNEAMIIVVTLINGSVIIMMMMVMVVVVAMMMMMIIIIIIIIIHIRNINNTYNNIRE